jgi:hypothetical protein
MLRGNLGLTQLLIEVDSAVELGGHDPTGGRSINGEMDRKLSGKEQDAVWKARSR